MLESDCVYNFSKFVIPNTLIIDKLSSIINLFSPLIGPFSWRIKMRIIFLTGMSVSYTTLPPIQAKSFFCTGKVACRANCHAGRKNDPQNVPQGQLIWQVSAYL